VHGDGNAETVGQDGPVLIRRPVLDVIADGSVTALFRRGTGRGARGRHPAHRGRALEFTAVEPGYRLSPRGRAYLGR
jgi:hypothetical protein